MPLIKTYKIVRRYADGRDPQVVRQHLSLEAAQAHCRNPETSSTTATDPNREPGDWFDGYEEEGIP